MSDPVGGGAWRPAALDPSGAAVAAVPYAAQAPASPERWLGELAADGGPIVGAPDPVRTGDVAESAGRVLAMLGRS